MHVNIYMLLVLLFARLAALREPGRLSKAGWSVARSHLHVGSAVQLRLPPPLLHQEHGQHRLLRLPQPKRRQVVPRVATDDTFHAGEQATRSGTRVFRPKKGPAVSQGNPRDAYMYMRKKAGPSRTRGMKKKGCAQGMVGNFVLTSAATHLLEAGRRGCVPSHP